jgi:hypothetical protein
VEVQTLVKKVGFVSFYFILLEMMDLKYKTIIYLQSKNMFLLLKLIYKFLLYWYRYMLFCSMLLNCKISNANYIAVNSYIIYYKQ